MDNNHQNVQFYHDFKDRKTYAVDVNFDKQDLLELLSDPFKPIHFMVGIAKVHPNDQYVKSIGREISKENLSFVKFQFLESKLLSLQESLVVEYYSFENNMSIKFRLSDQSDKPHLLEVIDHNKINYF